MLGQAWAGPPCDLCSCVLVGAGAEGWGLPAPHTPVGWGAGLALICTVGREQGCAVVRNCSNTALG